MARIVLDLHPLSSATAALSSLNWPTLSIRRHFHRCLIMLKCLNKAVDFDFNFQLNMLLMFIITTLEIDKIYICNGPIGIGTNRHLPTTVHKNGMLYQRNFERPKHFSYSISLKHFSYSHFAYKIFNYSIVFYLFLFYQIPLYIVYQYSLKHFLIYSCLLYNSHAGPH